MHERKLTIRHAEENKIEKKAQTINNPLTHTEDHQRSQTLELNSVGSSFAIACVRMMTFE